MPTSSLANLKALTCMAFLVLSHAGKAQVTTGDSVIQLTEVRVNAYEQNRRLKDVPAAINHIGRPAMDRFSPTALVMAVNSQPGVRMEERSPGSYRINIRGSSLRSPFGVRNVKVYYNDLPITDPGGHTHLNALGFYNFGSLEIIKGPGSSLYGAGTGGVMLIESRSDRDHSGVEAEYTTGSYQLQNLYGAVTTGTTENGSKFSFQHQENNGYRLQSALRRDVASWSGSFKPGEKNQLKTSFLYSDLFYQTPGALTEAEFRANPKSARPAAGTFPGAEAARASISLRSFIAGASYSHALTDRLKSKTVVYGAFAHLLNPAIRNYGRSNEPHAGGRTLLQWKSSRLALDAGAEWQQGFTSYSIHRNRAGVADSLQTYDEIKNRQSFGFVQGALDLGRFVFTAGTSLNSMKFRLLRFLPRPAPEQVRSIRAQLAPRVALLYKLKAVNLYANIAKGFSPPTTSELLPTGSAINLALNPEEGINYSAGLKGRLLPGLYTDVNAFYFSLQNTIVQRRDAGGGDFFVNAGNTRQYGVETNLEWPSLLKGPWVGKSLLYLSHTWHRFHYGTFKQGSTDFSGNRLPGVAPHTIASGLDLLTKGGFISHITYFFSDKTPLNDANTAFASPYHLLGARVGYQREFKKKWHARTLLGVDNLLNERYSLGNDINGFGGRFFNAAPGRNFYLSLQLQRLGKQD